MAFLRISLCICCVFNLAPCVLAGSIIGGELTYKHVSGSTYLIQYKVWRHCVPSGDSSASWFDDTVYVAAYNASNVLIENIAVPKPVDSTFLQFEVLQQCLTDTPSLCMVEMAYIDTVAFDSVPSGGILLVAQHCCRPADAINLISGGTQGSTYLAQIPPPATAVNNGSPQWNNSPQVAVCRKSSIFLDFSATDPDGDSLVYGFCSPLQSGPNDSNTIPDLAMPPPYQQVQWVPPYGPNYQIASSPVLEIDPVTGYITGKPTVTGSFVHATCVKEYRNGILLNQVRRDFPMVIVDCVPDAMALVDSVSQNCTGLAVSFNASQSVGDVYYWDFGVDMNGKDTITSTSINYTYPDTGSYMVTMISEGDLCNDTVVIPVQVKPELFPDFDPPRPQCLSGNSFDFLASGEIYTSSLIEWDFGPLASQAQFTGKSVSGVSFSEAGEYLVTATAYDFGCVKSVSRTVTVLPDPKVVFPDVELQGCSPVQVELFPGTTGFLRSSFQWVTDQYDTTEGLSYSRTFHEEGTHRISFTARNDSICADTFNYEVAVAVYQSPKAGFLVSPYEQGLSSPDFQIFNRGEDFFTSRFYLDGSVVELDSFLYSFTDTGTFEIKHVVEAGHGCRDSISSDVRVKPEHLFFAPGAFSPDNNTHNEVWKPVAFAVKQYDLQIFNRQGERVFHSSQVENGWDGTKDNEPAPKGVYAFIIQATDFTGKTWHYEGTLTLLR